MEHNQLKTVLIGVVEQDVWAGIHGHQLANVNVYAGLFQDFACAGFSEALSWFHIATRNSPLAAVRAPYEQHLLSSGVKDCCRTAYC